MAAHLCSMNRLSGCSSAYIGAGRSTLLPRLPFRVQSPTPFIVTAGPIGPGKRWERYPTNDNGKPIRVRMHVKKGDTVIVVAGKDKGKVGEVTEVVSKLGTIVVKGVNIKTKHVRPKSAEQGGQILQRESPVHHSNVMLYSNEKGVRSRVGHKLTEDGKKVRYLIKTGEIID